MKKRITEKEIQKANIDYHTRMADFYDREQGHFKPENIKRVEKTIKNLARETGGGSLLDVGCGTGFIINIAQKYFDRVVGIDITPAMLKKVKKFRNVELYLTDLLSASFAEKFDVCTTYGVLHHLPDLKSSFKKISQFLRKGGYFYVDQDPNFYYLESIRKNQRYLSVLPEIVLKEWKSINEIEIELEKKFNINKKTTKIAEYHKLTKRGFFKEKKITGFFKETGFSDVKFKYQWFLGQGILKNKFSPRQLITIEKYLEEILPLSRGIFKYISFIAKK